MAKLSITRLPERCFWAALIACTVYQSYRYPLHMNSAGTSPTYIDTPFVFQIFKFLITLLLCLVAAGYVLGRRLHFSRWAMAVLVLCMSAYPALKAIQAGWANAAYMDLAFWPLAALTLVLAIRCVTFAGLNRYLRFVFYYAVATEAVQVLLFLSIGRLPALAYAGTFSIRFGSFLDDPNGSPALWYMLMGWAYYNYSGFRRILAEAALVLCVLLTQSFTALGFLGIVAVLFAGNYMLRKPKGIVVTGWVVFFGLALIAAWSKLVGFASILVRDRIGSIDQHLSQVSSTNTAIGLDWLFGVPTYTSYESWWVGSMVNFGIPWYLLTLAIVTTLVLAIVAGYRRARGRTEKAVFTSFLLLALYFFIGNANLPLIIDFPIDFLFFLFGFLVFFKKIEKTGEQQSLAVPDRGVGFATPLSAQR